MRTILMSGALNYSGLLADWTTWTELHRVKPDVILVDHTFVEELASVDDKKRVSYNDGPVTGPQLLFMAIPVHCFCSLKYADPSGFDCPQASSEFDLDLDVDSNDARDK